MDFDAYPLLDNFYDETFAHAGEPHEFCKAFIDRLARMSDVELVSRQASAEQLLRNLGITFTVYGHEAGTEKAWPFDLLPRMVDGQEWTRVEEGLKQRVEALNLFIGDLYNKQQIIKDGTFPLEMIESSKNYRKQMMGFTPPLNVWCHISGVDLIRGGDGEFYVLEDNLRCPSGVSYVLENREVMKRTFGSMFEGMQVASVVDYPERLLNMLLDCANEDPKREGEPTAVLLTPGIYNSAYFEHTFLAQKMGIQLVQGSDLVVVDDYVYMRETSGLKKVDVIYRRIDDDFIDPKCFNADSVLGAAGLMEAYKKGNVTLANAPGAGVADDKAVYTYVPQIIKYYLGEDAILQNVPTYMCSDPKQRQHVLTHMNELVIKPVNESGGYGIVMGPQASKKELEEAAELIKDNPRNYVAQPMISLSTVPTLSGEKLCPRHVDLRPFVLSGKSTYVMPGGLTRVALREGSMVVNSSQGGGSKDTWVVSSDGGRPSDFESQSQSQSSGMSQTQSNQQSSESENA